MVAKYEFFLAVSHSVRYSSSHMQHQNHSLEAISSPYNAFYSMFDDFLVKVLAHKWNSPVFKTGSIHTLQRLKA